MTHKISPKQKKTLENEKFNNIGSGDEKKEKNITGAIYSFVIS